MICLIRPPAVEWFRFTSTSITLPLGLAYIAGALEASGRTVHVLDAVGEGPDVLTRYYKGHLIGIPLKDIVARIPADAEWVGITAIFTHEWPAVVRLIDLIKEARPELTVVLGGEHMRTIAGDGWDKARIRRFLFEHTQNTHAHLKRTQLMAGAVQPGDETRWRPLVESPDDILVVAAGGSAGAFSAYIPGWGSKRASQAVTKEVKR